MTPFPKPPVYCKFCGAKLRKDIVGPYCPTKNCQWQYGLPTEEGGLQEPEPKTKKKRKARRAK